MTLSPADWSIIIAYLLLSLGIGLYYKDKASKSLTDFFLGGRNLPWYIAGTSMVATTFAADTPLAVNELVARNGISGNWLWWNMLLGGMLTTFFFARLWRRSEILTEVEFIELRYSGKAAALLRGFKSLYLGIFMNCLIIGWVNIALQSILMVFFGISKEEALWYVAAAMLITAVYSSISGLWGVAVTDVIQFGIAMAGCIILAIIVVNSDRIGGIVGLKSKLPPWSLNFFPDISVAGTREVSRTLVIGAGTFLAYVSIWWSSWYPGAEPGGGGYIAQRMMSTKNEKHSLFATLFFQVAHYCLRPWPWIIVGLCSIVLYPELGDADKKLGYVMAMREFLPPGLKGLLVVAFLAAYMSTISTQLNWGSSYVINDFYKRFIRPENAFPTPGDAQKNYILASRVFTILSMLIALFVTTKIETISGVWSFIIECGAGLGLVLILRWFWWRINAWSEITATVAPFGGYAFSKFILHLDFPDSFFVTVGFTTFAWLAVTFLTRPGDENKLTAFYEKVRPGGLWPSRIKKNSKEEKSSWKMLLVCWISSVVMTYSILFMTGKFIFLEWAEALYWCASAGIMLAVLVFSINKSGIFKN